MKHFKTFESFLNEEADQAVKKAASTECKNAMKEAQKEIEKLLNDCKKAGLLNSFKTEIKNLKNMGGGISGYSLEISAKNIDSDLTWYAERSGSFNPKPKEDGAVVTPQEQYFMNWLTSNVVSSANNGIEIVPDPSFESKIETGKKTYIEGRFLSFNGPAQYGNLKNEGNDFFYVENKEGISKAAQEWLGVIKNQIEASRNSMGL